MPVQLSLAVFCLSNHLQISFDWFYCSNFCLRCRSKPALFHLNPTEPERKCGVRMCLSWYPFKFSGQFLQVHSLSRISHFVYRQRNTQSSEGRSNPALVSYDNVDYNERHKSKVFQTAKLQTQVVQANKYTALVCSLISYHCYAR